jgi:hypothetical protein
MIQPLFKETLTIAGLKMMDARKAKSQMTTISSSQPLVILKFLRAATRKTTILMRTQLMRLLKRILHVIL